MDGLEARLIDGDRLYKDDQYLYYEDRIAVPEDDWMVAYSGPISVDGTQGATGLLTVPGSLSTPDYPVLSYVLVCSS